MRRILLCVVILAALSMVGFAQAPTPTGKVPTEGESNPNEVYGGFLWEPTDWGAAWQNYYGFDANYTRFLTRHWGAVADFDFTRSNASEAGDLDLGRPHNSHEFAYRFGPRYTILSRKHRFQPYAVGLIGGANFTALFPYPTHESPLQQKNWFGFTWAVGGGVDVRVTHHLGLRGEWDHTRVPWGSQYLKSDTSDWDRITFGGFWRW